MIRPISRQMVMIIERIPRMLITRSRSHSMVISGHPPSSPTWVILTLIIILDIAGFGFVMGMKERKIVSIERRGKGV
jgi:hypothetical protein